MEIARRLPVSLVILILTLFFTALFIPSIGYAVSSGEHGDYPWHHDIAERYSNGENIGTPHVLYHVLVLLLGDLFALAPDQTAAILAVAFKAATGVSLFFIIRAQPQSSISDKLNILIVSVFLLTVPLYVAIEPSVLFFPPSYTVYQSPTQNLLFLLVVPASLIAMRAAIPQPFENANQRAFFTLLFGLFNALVLISKPSYSIALLPSLALIVLYRLIRRLPIDWTLLILGVLLPQVILLGVQYIVTYNDPNRASVEIGFLAFLQESGMAQGEIVLRVALSLALTLAFPAVVYILHFKDALQDDYLNFAWLTFGISCIWGYFFYESGVRFNHANFFSTANSALFVLMFSTILFLIKHYSANRCEAEVTQPTA